MTLRPPLPAEMDLDPDQVVDLARRRRDIERDLAAALDQAEADRRAMEREARDIYANHCATAHRVHGERLAQVEALSLEARLEARQLAATDR